MEQDPFTPRFQAGIDSPDDETRTRVGRLAASTGPTDRRDGPDEAHHGEHELHSADDERQRTGPVEPAPVAVSARFWSTARRLERRNGLGGGIPISVPAAHAGGNNRGKTTAVRIRTHKDLTPEKLGTYIHDLTGFRLRRHGLFQGVHAAHSTA